jgi:hypothetical protein
MSAAERPVVIQTMWRTGGTYLAFALRERNPLAMFYEPLHEDYSDHTQAQFDGYHEAGAEVIRRHPTKSFHYMTDYPFLPGGGVAGHRRDFAYRRFVLRRGDKDPDLRAYLQGLTASAAAGRRPLFKFCRAFLRQPWLEATLDPVTIYLARRPSGMQASFRSLGLGGYFYSGFLRVLHCNREDPVLAPVYDFVAGRHPDFARADEALLWREQLFLTVSPETYGDVFLFFWAVALAAHAAPTILTLDVAALAQSRERSAEALARHTGLVVDLSDAAALDFGDTTALRFERPAEFGRFLAAALPDVAPRLDPGALPQALRRQLDLLLTF